MQIFKSISINADAAEKDDAVACNICRMFLNGPYQYRDHLKGKRHRQNMDKQREQGRGAVDGISKAPGGGGGGAPAGGKLHAAAEPPSAEPEATGKGEPGSLERRQAPVGLERRQAPVGL